MMSPPIFLHLTVHTYLQHFYVIQSCPHSENTYEIWRRDKKQTMHALFSETKVTRLTDSKLLNYYKSIMIIHGDKLQVPAHLNYGKFILEHIRSASPDDVCMENYDSGKRLTFRQYAEHAVSLSVALSELGVTRGDVVGVGSEKRVTFLPTTLAVLLAGAAYSPFALSVGRAVFSHELSLSKPAYFICSKLFWNAYGDIIKGFEFIKTIICFDEIDEIELSMKKLMNRPLDLETFEAVGVQGQTDTAIILYSSGTTGMPKAVPVTHLGCIARKSPLIFENEDIKTVLIIGDWAHSYDTDNSHHILTGKRKIVYTDVLTTDNFLKCIYKNQVNVIILTPVLVNYLAKAEEVKDYDLSSLKVIFSAAAPLHQEIVEMIKNRLPEVRHILQLYGMTESGEITSERWGVKSSKQGSVGRACPGMFVKVVDLKTRQPLGPNQRGEICVQGPALMKGYIGVDASTYLDEQGFFLTGDLGYYDEDENFYIVDRLKNMINSDGFEVAPIELETILMRHPGVAEACVVGKPAGAWGAEPTAFVVRTPGSSVTEEQLINYVSIEVSPHMQLKGGVKFISHLPRDPRSKVQRRQLIEILNN